MKKKRLSFIRAFFAILFGIPLLACVIVLIVTMRIDSLFQPKELASAVMENLDASTLKAADLIGDADEGQSLASYISDQIADATGDEIQISDADLEKILSDKTVRNFLSDKLKGYMDYLGGDDDAVASISADEIYKLLDENRDMIEEVTGEKITDEHMDVVRENLEKIDFDNADLSQMKNKDLEEVRDAFSYVKKVSGWAPWAALGVCLLFVLIIALFRGRFICGTFAETGIVGLLGSGAVLMTGMSGVMESFISEDSKALPIVTTAAGVLRDP